MGARRMRGTKLGALWMVAGLLGVLGCDDDAARPPTNPDPTDIFNSSNNLPSPDAGCDACDVSPPPPELPCLEIDTPEEIALSGVVGRSSTRMITLRSCAAGAPLELTSLRLLPGAGPDLQLEALPSLPLTLAPGEVTTFLLAFTPTETTPQRATLELRSNDATQDPLLRPIVAQARANNCPTAVAKARVDGSDDPWQSELEVLALQSLWLSAGDSFDPDAPGDRDAIQRVEWTVVEQPALSTARFLPSADVRGPRFWLSVPGRYVFELTVFDADGTPSCSPGRVVAVALPEPGLQIFVTWDTPGDADQQDTGVGRGSDLDLHLLSLQPSAAWNSPPWDCYWLNREPRWGDADRDDDDPRLLIDDGDGAGPELIAITTPSPGRYSVGVYTHSDTGYGPSYPTLNIYYGGDLRYELTGPGLLTDHFWSAALLDIDEDGALHIEALDTLTEGFPLNP